MRLFLILIFCISNNFNLLAEAKRPKKGSIDIGKGSPVSTKDLPTKALNNLFTRIANKTSKSVVSVSTFIKGISRNERNEKLWEYFYGTPYPYKDKQKNKQLERPLGVGSGFIISSQGHILTNAHVIKQATRVKITLYNKNTYEADVVGIDEKTDVAVVKINAPKNELKTLPFGASNKVRIGEWVLAIGNPFGYDNTVTTGIISATGRRTQFNQGNGYYNYIQTDAAINPGNSGGPLVNLQGEVIGINTLIVSKSGGYQGLSFAIPIRMAKKVAEDLIYEGKVIRGFLGVEITNVSSNLSLALGLKTGYGAQIQGLVEESPAVFAGLKISDIILKIDDTEIEDASFLRNIVSELSPQETYNFYILRGEKKLTIDVRIGSLNQDFNYNSKNGTDQSKIYGEYIVPHLGFNYKKLTVDLAKELQIPSNEGVVVSEIRSSFIARNLKVGDIILSYKSSKNRNFIKITNPKDFHKDLKNIGSEKNIAFYVLSNGKKRLIAIRARKK